MNDILVLSSIILSGDKNTIVKLTVQIKEYQHKVKLWQIKNSHHMTVHKNISFWILGKGEKNENNSNFTA